MTQAGDGCAVPDGMNVVELIKEYLRTRSGSTAGYSISMLVFPIGSVYIPAMLGVILDKVKDKVPFSEWKTSLYCIIIAFLIVLAAYLAGIYLDSFVKTDIQNYMRQKVFSKVMDAYSRNFKTLQVSSIVSKVMKLPVSTFQLVTDWRLYLLPGMLTMLAVICYFFYVDWRLGAMISVTTIIIGILMVFATHVCLPALIAADYEHDFIHESMGDSLENLVNIFLSDASESELKRFERYQTVYLRNMKSAVDCVNHFTGLAKLLLGILVAGIIISTYKRYIRGDFTAGQLVGILFVLMCSRHAIYGTLWNLPTHLMNLGSVKKMEDYYSILIKQGAAHKPAVMNSEDPVTIKTTCSKGIKFENVDFLYPGSTRQALKGASFEAKRGDMIRVTGHIGSGKSTIALLSLGLYPFEGSIEVCGRDIRTLPRSSIAQLISFVPQGPKLLDRTVYENISFGTKFSREEVQKALTDFEVDFIDLDSRVGKSGSQLSTGQRATIYLIRAAMRQTPIIICDEVTANMDSKSEARVLELLKRICAGRTLIFISHQDVKLPFTKQLVLENGTIREK